jgi:hypothetical protein
MGVEIIDDPTAIIVAGDPTSLDLEIIKERGIF